MSLLKSLVFLVLISRGSCDDSDDSDRGISDAFEIFMIVVVSFLLLVVCFFLCRPGARDYVSTKLGFDKSAAADGTYRFPMIPSQRAQQKGAQGGGGL